MVGACTRNDRNEYTIFVQKVEGKRLLEWENHDKWVFSTQGVGGGLDSND
jgi:hypothetical protein